MNAVPGRRFATAGVLAALLVGAAGAGGISLVSGAPSARTQRGADPGGQSTLGFPRPSGTQAPDGGAPLSSVPSTSAAPRPTTRPAPPPTRRAPPQTAPPTSSRPPSTTDLVLARVNRERAAVGCRPLTGDARLDRSARQHSADMVERDYFSHDTPDGVSFDERERAAGYPQPGGENIARGFRTADAVVQAWMRSDAHRRNILDCGFTAMGVGLDTRGFLWTQDFGR